MPLGGGHEELSGWQGERKEGQGKQKGGVQDRPGQSKQEGERLEGRAC